MNMQIKGKFCNTSMFLLSDSFIEKAETEDAETAQQLAEIIDGHTATSFTYFEEFAGRITKKRIIVYNYADENGDRRAGFFSNGRPTGHVNDIRKAIDDILSLIWNGCDLYIKAV